jgi:hypothetical protein
MSLPGSSAELTFTLWEFDGGGYARATRTPPVPGGSTIVPAVTVTVPFTP